MYKVLNKLIALSLLVFVSVSYGQTWDAQSFGPTEAYAREQVLSHLASNLYVQIESESVSVADTVKGLKSTTKTKATTHLPILGAQVDCFAKSNEYTCHGLLDSQQAAPLYLQKLTLLSDEIQHTEKAIDSMSQIQQEQALAKAINQIDEWYRLREVLALLSSADAKKASLDVSKHDLMERLQQSVSQSKSLAHAAKQLVKNITQSNILILPATLQSSREVTEFAQAMKVHLESVLGGKTTSLNRAEYYFEGQYAKHGKGITVNYRLVDRQGSVVAARLVRLAPSAFAHLNTQPKAVDFDQLLHSGYAVSSDFSVQLRTNRGMRDLAFMAGESVELFIKLNQPGYYYLVGHTKSNQGEKSYLLDLQDAPGNRKFIQYVNADDANRWMSLGEFEIEPPFGVESLQVMALKNDPMDLIPYTEFDGTYYTIAKSVSEGVSKTRGLVKKKKKASEVNPAEAVLMFTTLPRVVTD
ncbi:hypothetical protein ACFOEK_03530 [Litoribrevibacter euphylliae]|uniref:DUF4384 domain-containing protein n=1 Tax=Litoribrevibacter euphylliae TaxID=1834034 RepID=A0ABV7HBL1_9GAMM